MTETATRPLPMLLAEVEATAVERLSPSYVRVELGGPALADFGVDGPLYDQRIKLLLPNDAGRLPAFRPEVEEEGWYAAWQALPEAERGHLRTYSVRAVRGTGTGTRLVVDFVLHLQPGATGPGSTWASRAQVGDRLVVVAPRRGVPFGGIEFAPGDARVLLAAADETAVPAVCRILEDLPADACGSAFLEVPLGADIQEVRGPAGVEVVWLARGGRPLGEPLTAAVRAHLGSGPAAGPGAPQVVVEEVDPDLWETPTYSSSGADLTGSARPGGPGAGSPLDGLYAWIAGEAGVVTALRRHLVKDLGMDRRQVAFMGYWRRGVAMRY
ncbi:siderophore-interacting protein [Nocardioides sp. GCM10027113]|uniref:siderophore-interacting protein n=1 Tax=unclassified Nocardioides TaxID=2615069 RepID=UPI00360EFA3A